MQEPIPLFRVYAGLIDRYSHHSLLVNAFRPGTEIVEPALFAGREEQVAELANALHAEGASPIIYGDRGLGKSSLAIQLQRIAMADVELLTTMGLEERAIPAEGAYIAFYVPCSDNVRTTDDLLQRLINSAEGISLLDRQEGATELVDRTTRKTVSLKLFKAESIKRFVQTTTKGRYTKLGVEERLLEVVRLLNDMSGQPILFIIDELDRVRNKTGLASFIKAAPSDGLKFALVGIADTISDLVNDHRSIERLAVPVAVPRMTDKELVQIVTKAMQRLEEQGIRFKFTVDALVAISGLASGFPWFVHVLGQESVMMAELEETDVITEDHILGAAKSLTGNRFAQQFSDRYQIAVRDAYQREIVLRCFAEWRDRDIPTADVYRVCRDLKVANPSAYKGHLSSDKYGPVLLTPAFQQRGMVRFANEMFKVYARIRPSLYKGLDEKVKEAWANR